MSEWTETTIGEVSAVFDGPHATPAKVSEGPIFLGISCLSRGRLDLTAAEHLSEHDFKRWTRRVEPTAGDVVFSYETRLGEVALIPPGLRCCLGRRMALIRPDRTKIDSRFLLYYYLSPEFQDLIRSRTVPGSTVDRIFLEEFPKFPVRVPDLATQREVASLLSAIDDKIELNRRVNQTLESMARAIFRSWFVDFDAVVAKVAGRQPFGMSSDVAALFPDRFVDSAIGAIPNGWSTRSIYEFAQFVNGAPFKGSHFSPDRSGLPIVKIAELKYGIAEQTQFTTQSHDEKYRLATGDVLFSWSGSPETSIGTFVWSGGSAWLNQHIFRVSPNRKEDDLFVYYALLRLNVEFIEIARNKQTTGLGHVTVADLKRLLVVAPSDSAVRAFNYIVRPSYTKWFGTTLESRTLAALRDALLPKLMSGELRVRDAEKLVGTHV